MYYRDIQITALKEDQSTTTWVYVAIETPSASLNPERGEGDDGFKATATVVMPTDWKTRAQSKMQLSFLRACAILKTWHWHPGYGANWAL